MGEYRRYRNIERSIKFHLKTQIDGSWTGVQTVFEFINQDLDTTKPIVSIYQDSVPYRKQAEIGETDLEENFMLVVTVYAENDAQRLDLASTIIDALKTGCKYHVYSYNPDNPDEPSKVDRGFINIEFLSDNKIYPSENVESYSKYIQRIVFTGEILLNT